MLIILDMPVGTEFGIDYNSWHVGPKFKGVKMIPPGLHFVYYRFVPPPKTAHPCTQSVVQPVCQRLVAL